MNFLNKTEYNELILAQEDTVFFKIIEEEKTKSIKYGDAVQEWMKLTRKLDPTTGASNTKICNRFANCKLDDITRDLEEWITNL